MSELEKVAVKRMPMVEEPKPQEVRYFGNRKPKTRYVIGIDPDKKKSGWAVYDRLLNQWRGQCARFWPIIELCREFKRYEVVIVVEAGWLNKGMNSYQKKTRPKDFYDWSKERQEAYIFQRGSDVGVNFGVGEMLIQVLQEFGYTVKLWPPKGKKWNEHLLRLYTGITNVADQELRDAIRAAYRNLDSIE